MPCAALCAPLLLAASVFAHAFGLGPGGRPTPNRLPAPAAVCRTGVETRFGAAGRRDAHAAARRAGRRGLTAPACWCRACRPTRTAYRLEFELQPEGSAPVHIAPAPWSGAPAMRTASG